ncbi:RmlC-like cupins superfamily protein [Klebsormidium nitens]|uniref:Germin-like protein n=1 Tax=Klebsormidium nitens TaxID=105231 RepID=A0A1Y1IJS0_KLENI|nr:RmlC-like cupins superfamily protein [Klebsormidium nitens]|eukprot:GAQ89381.1 RmlC-like cupins superfamily protein [Klebsormidium nitens]
MAISYRAGLALLVLAAAVLMASAADPDPLADFLLPGLTGAEVTGANFAFRRLDNVTVPPGQGSATKSANAATFPAVTSQGVSYTFIDYAPCGQNPIHTHPRGTELLFVVVGQLYVGFVDTNNTLYATTLNAGDVFVFPRGLIHFQQNTSPRKPAKALAAFNSQNPGTQRIGSALFLPTGIPTSIEQVAFNAKASTIEAIKQNFPPSGNAVGTEKTGCGPSGFFP